MSDPVVTDLSAAFRTELERLIVAGDKPGAVMLALDAVEKGTIDIPELYGLLGDLMVRIGERWRTGETAVWQEHRASGIARTIVEALYPQVRSRVCSAIGGRTILLACPQDETHDLGLRMLADRFDLAGWRTCTLGADTPTVEIAAAARALRADIIVLSVSTHFHRVGVRALLDAMHAELPETRVMVGGPAFDRERHGLTDGEVLDLDALLGPAAEAEER